MKTMYSIWWCRAHLEEGLSLHVGWEMLEDKAECKHYCALKFVASSRGVAEGVLEEYRRCQHDISRELQFKKDVDGATKAGLDLDEYRRSINSAPITKLKEKLVECLLESDKLHLSEKDWDDIFEEYRSTTTKNSDTPLCEYCKNQTDYDNFCLVLTRAGKARCLDPYKSCTFFEDRRTSNPILKRIGGTPSAS